MNWLNILVLITVSLQWKVSAGGERLFPNFHWKEQHYSFKVWFSQSRKKLLWRSYLNKDIQKNEYWWIWPINVLSFYSHTSVITNEKYILILTPLETFKISNYVVFIISLSSGLLETYENRIEPFWRSNILFWSKAT